MQTLTSSFLRYWRDFVVRTASRFRIASRRINSEPSSGAAKVGTSILPGCKHDDAAAEVLGHIEITFETLQSLLPHNRAV